MLLKYLRWQAGRGKLVKFKHRHQTLFQHTHRLVGDCFQERYKAILCDAKAYLLELVRYIHLNPVRAGLAETPEEYPWSSHSLYLTGHDSGGVAVKDILGRFSSARDRAVAAYCAVLRDGVAEGHRQDFYAVVSQRFLSVTDRFVEQMEKKAPRRAQRTPVRVRLETLTPQIASALGVSAIHLHEKGRSRAFALARAIIAYVAQEEGAIPLTKRPIPPPRPGHPEPGTSTAASPHGARSSAGGENRLSPAHHSAWRRAEDR